MITSIGDRFQPGTDSFEQRQNRQRETTGSGEGVQEAIKVLSLRIPKVVGAQAIAPSPLLNSQGSGGNSRVDSIVAQVMQKYFPTGDAPTAQAPGVPSAPMSQQDSGASFGGLRQQDVGEDHSYSQRPRIIVGTPPEAPMFGGPPHPGAATWDGGWSPTQFGNIEPLPDLKRLLDWVPSAPDSRDNVPLI